MTLFDNDDVKIHCLILSSPGRWDLLTVPFITVPDFQLLKTKIKVTLKLDEFTIRLFTVPIPTHGIEAFMLGSNQIELKKPSPTQKLSEIGLKPGYAHIAILICEFHKSAHLQCLVYLPDIIDNRPSVLDHCKSLASPSEIAVNEVSEISNDTKAQFQHIWIVTKFSEEAVEWFRQQPSVIIPLLSDIYRH